MLRFALLALVAVLAVPGVAAAGTVSKSGTVVTFEGDAGNETVNVTLDATFARFSGDVVAGSGYNADRTCARSGVTSIVMRGAGGSDAFALDNTVTIAATLDGGSGRMCCAAARARTVWRCATAVPTARPAAAPDTVVADTIDSVSGCEAIDANTSLERDADHDGWARPADCNDGAPSIHPAAVDVPQNGIDENCVSGDELFADRDGDGTPSPLDCDDGDPGQHPRKRDPRQRQGRRLRRPLVSVAAAPGYGLEPLAPVGRRPDRRPLRRLRRAARSLVQLRCFGFKCPFERVQRRVTKFKKRLSLNRHVRGKRFLKGRRIELVLTNRRFLGRQIRYYDVTGAAVQRVERCAASLAAGRPTADPATMGR